MPIEPLRGNWSADAVFAYAMDEIRNTDRGAPRAAIAIWINGDGALSHAITKTTFTDLAVFAAWTAKLSMNAMEP